jgi:hypothetical protein
MLRITVPPPPCVYMIADSYVDIQSCRAFVMHDLLWAIIGFVLEMYQIT